MLNNRYIELVFSLAFALVVHQLFAMDDEMAPSAKPGAATEPEPAVVSEAADPLERDLLKACDEGNLDEVKRLLAIPGIKVNALYWGTTALHRAVLSNNLTIAQLLIEHGAYVNTKHSRDGSTALHLAAAGDYRAMVQLLVTHGAHVNAKNRDGKTALQGAIIAGHLHTARYLIDHGAHIINDNKSVTPLIIEAAARGYLGIVQLLHSEGANLNEGADFGETALMVAASRLLGYEAEVVADDPELAAHGAKHFEVVKYLVENGADVNVCPHGTLTALKLAKKGFDEVGGIEFENIIAYLTKTMSRRSILYSLLACDEFVKPKAETNEEFPPEIIDRIVRPILATALIGE